MNVYTFGRAEIEDGIDVAEPYSLISISTPPREEMAQAMGFLEDFSSASLPPDEFRLQVLRLRFDDLDNWPIGLTDQSRAFIGLYSPELAQQVAAFVRAWGRHSIAVHCDAGISRSQGMADAIADHLGVKARHFRRGMPNRLVYKLTYDALRPGETVGARLRGVPPLAGGSHGTDPLTIPQVTVRPVRDKYRLT